MSILRCWPPSSNHADPRAMDTGTAGGGLTVVDYLRPVWRFKFAVVLVVALAAAGTYLYTRRETKVYDTSTELYVGQSSLQQLLNPNNGSQDPRILADQAQLLQTPSGGCGRSSEPALALLARRLAWRDLGNSEHYLGFPRHHGSNGQSSARRPAGERICPGIPSGEQSRPACGGENQLGGDGESAAEAASGGR